jgi:hypothetical protein
MGLDEYTEKQLLAELERRRALRNSGLCDYCERAADTTPCRFPERHSHAHPLDTDDKASLADTGMKRRK